MYCFVVALTNPLAGQEGEHALVAKTLTVDHKPEDPNEIARIEKQGRLPTLIHSKCMYCHGCSCLYHDLLWFWFCNCIEVVFTQ